MRVEITVGRFARHGLPVRIFEPTMEQMLVLQAENVAGYPTSLMSVDAVLNQFRSGIRGLYS